MSTHHPAGQREVGERRDPERERERKIEAKATQHQVVLAPCRRKE